MKIRLLAAALLAGVAVANVAGAQDFDNRWYVTGSVGMNFQDNDRNTEDTPFGAIGLGKQISPSVAVDVELNYQNPATTRNSDLYWHQYGISLDLRKFFMNDKAWRPYVVGGLGYQYHSEEIAALNNNGPTHRKDGGLGAKAGIGLQSEGKRVKVRTEIAYRLDMDDEGVSPNFTGSIDDKDSFADLLASIGVVVPLGALPVAPVVEAPVAPSCSDLDDDGDGVNNCNDKCPGSQAGEAIGADGCAVPVSIDLKGVNFDFDKSTLRPDAIEILNNAVEVLKRNPAMRVEVAGHTDLCGSDTYNQSLSERRARVVYDYLTANGIDASRLAGPNGYGESRPLENTPQTLPACKSETNRRTELNTGA